MSVINFPNGQTLTSSALTTQQVEIIFQIWTSSAFGYNPPDPERVRINWQVQGQPFDHLPNDDVAYIAATLKDDNYTKVRNRQNVGTIETWTYTRNWNVAWVVYGPNSFDFARALHTASFLDYFNDQLNTNNLFPVSEPPQPIRVPELINAQWFQRSDFELNLYENVTEVLNQGIVTSAEIELYDSTGEVADITVTRS